MGKISQWTVGQRVMLLFGVISIILVVIGGLFFFSLRLIAYNNRVQESSALTKLAVIDDTAQDIGQMQAGILREILSSDPTEIKNLDQTVRDTEKINFKELTDFQKSVNTEKEKPLYDKVMQARKAYWEQTEQVLAFAFANRDAEATTLINSKQGPAYDELLTAFNDLIASVESDANQTAETTAGFISKIRMIGDILVGVAIFITLGTGFALVGITERLKKDNVVLQTEVAERKRAEETLHESEGKFRQLAENISDAFWITSPDLQKVLYVSPAYELIWGRSVASAYAHPLEWAEAILPEERERVFAAFSTLGTGALDVSVEFQITRPDGKTRWVHSRGFPVRDAAANVIRLAGVATDITERKHSQEMLRESEEKFRQLADNITDVFWITSPDLSIIHYINAEYERIWGRSIESLYANPHQWIEAILPEERERVSAVFRTLMENEPKVSVEYRIAHPDGTIRWIHDRGFQVRDAAGNLIRLAGIASDITERKQIEESLQLLGSAVEQSKESIIITNAELDLPGPKILFVNFAFTKMTGYTSEEVLGKTPRILQGPRTDKAVLSRLRKNLEQGEAFEGETINYRKDGTAFDLQWQIAPIRNAEGKTTHFTAIQRDVTDLNLLEARMFQSQKMETVGKLAGGVAHEFNSILTAIIGQSELLLSDLPPDGPLGKGAREIRRAADRAAILTRQLLAYGRKQILQPEILDLNRVIAEMRSTLQHLMGREVDVQIARASGLKMVKIDPGQMEQVIVNIAMNAADAMPNGGRLTLETANVTLDEEYVRAFEGLKSGSYVMLAITDTGIGMSEAVKARVFEPFFSTKGVGQGTGLGLATCYGILKQSDGHINVYSEVARGATFKIYLPGVEKQTTAPLPRVTPAGLPRGTETILLAEDDPSLLEMSATLLKRLGYNVLTAVDGVEALNLKNQRDIGHIDLLFTDVVMPHMSGKELSDRIRTIYPHTKILFTSAYTESAIVHQGILDEGVILLQKPFTPSALAHKVREILDQPSPPPRE